VNQAGFHRAQNAGLMTVIKVRRRHLNMERRQGGPVASLFPR
jgi:hypothetical protein